jgi:hypothetical protein
MSGAAAESILLSTAIAKEGNEERVLKSYTATGGRKRIADLLFGKAQGTPRRISPSLIVLKYWRDEAGHGKASNINDDEAFYALAFLLRLAVFMHDNWEMLTKAP